MSKLFGKKKKQQQGNGGGAAGGGGTGTEAAALRGPRRGLGGRIQDGWDRFKYWAGGGGAAVNNKTRNWLADGKEGSWRRNKADRLVDKEFHQGMPLLQSHMRNENERNLEALRNSFQIDPEVYHAAKRKNVNSQLAHRVQYDIADMWEAGLIGRRDHRVIEDLLQAYDDSEAAGANDFGELYNTICSGNGSAARGLARKDVRDRVMAQPGYYQMSQDQKDKELEEAYKLEYKKRGISDDKTKISQKYSDLMLERIQDEMRKGEAERMERSERGSRKKAEMLAGLHNREQG